MRTAEGDGWGSDDLDHMAARVRGVVESMSREWRGRPLGEIEQELTRRLANLGHRWPPEATEHLVRQIADPRWHLRHPLQAIGVGLRFHALVRSHVH